MLATRVASAARRISAPISRNAVVVCVTRSAARGFATGKGSVVPASKDKESVDKIKTSLVTLVNEELAARKDQDNEGTPMWELAQKWASDSGFEIAENVEGEVTMTRKVGNHTVTVKFNPNDDLSDLEENEQPPAHDEEEGEEGENQMEGARPKDIHFEVKVQFGDKGDLTLSAFTGEDNRLYVDALAARDSLAEDAKVREFDWYSLGDDTQDRMYDFFDKLGVDDQLAHYVKQYTLQSEQNREVDFLTTFRSLLSGAK